jgi:hypothetical protein
VQNRRLLIPLLFETAERLLARDDRDHGDVRNPKEKGNKAPARRSSRYAAYFRDPGEPIHSLVR